MSRLLWDQELNRRYELGVDRGVFYPKVGTPEPWNGLVSINESSVSDGVSSYYLDGIKYFDEVLNSLTQLTVTAMSAPLGLEEALGNVSVVPGFILTKQKKVEFDFSYRTQIGDNLGYKLHLVYNAVAKPSNKKNVTLSNNNSLEPRSWTISSTPVKISELAPMTQIIFDSTKMVPELLSFLEVILYGDDETPPRLPTIFELSNVFKIFKPYQILYSNLGYSNFTLGIGDVLGTKVDGIFSIFDKSRLKPDLNSNFYRLEH